MSTIDWIKKKQNLFGPLKQDEESTKNGQSPKTHQTNTIKTTKKGFFGKNSPQIAEQPFVQIKNYQKLDSLPDSVDLLGNNRLSEKISSITTKTSFKKIGDSGSDKKRFSSPNNKWLTDSTSKEQKSSLHGCRKEEGKSSMLILNNLLMKVKKNNKDPIWRINLTENPQKKNDSANEKKETESHSSIDFFWDKNKREKLIERILSSDLEDRSCLISTSKTFENYETLSIKKNEPFTFKKLDFKRKIGEEKFKLPELHFPFSSSAKKDRSNEKRVIKCYQFSQKLNLEKAIFNNKKDQDLNQIVADLEKEKCIVLEERVSRFLMMVEFERVLLIAKQLAEIHQKI